MPVTKQCEPCICYDPAGKYISLEMWGLVLPLLSSNAIRFVIINYKKEVFIINYQKEVLIINYQKLSKGSVDTLYDP